MKYVNIEYTLYDGSNGIHLILSDFMDNKVVPQVDLFNDVMRSTVDVTELDTYVELRRSLVGQLKDDIK